MTLLMNNIRAREEGSLKFTIQFTNMDGESAVPKTLKYTLLTSKGDTVNSKKDIDVMSLSESVVIGVYGDDLVLSGAGSKRYLLLEWTYDDADIGNDIPDSETIAFDIESVVGIPE